MAWNISALGAFFANFANLFTKKEKTKDIQAQPIKHNTLSVSAGSLGGGRSSVPRNAFLNNSTASIPPDFPIQKLALLNRLVMTSPDFAHAAQSFMDLCNTPQTISFTGASERQKAKMLAHLEESEKKWVPFSGSFTLTNSLIYQVVANGVLSAEAYPNEDLTGMGGVALVGPEHIVFFLENGNYKPYQIVQSLPANFKGKNRGQYVPLNANSYRYTPLVKAGDSPYGIPPFLSAIIPHEIQTNMVTNFKYIVEKLGALGFISALITPPEQEENESDDDYQNRVENIIDAQALEVAKGFNAGFMVGLKDIHQITVTGNSTNAANADKLFDIADRLLASGLKTSPAFLGRNQTASEAYARVDLSKQMAQAETVQRCVAEFLDHARLLDLRLAGFQVQSVKTTFRSPIEGDEAKKEETFAKKIDNLNKLVEQGVISHEERARILGFGAPHLHEPPAKTDSTPKATPTNKDKGGRSEPTGESKPADKSLSDYANILREILGAPSEEFCYTLPTVYAGEEQASLADANTQKMTDNYTQTVEALFAKAIAKVQENLQEALQEASLESAKDLQDVALETLYDVWSSAFAKPVATIAKKQVGKLYSYYRKDKSIFPADSETATQNSYKFVVPEADLDMVDERVLEWLKNHDLHFISKFITDEDTTQRIIAFIQKYYIENGEAIGKNEQVLADFAKEFGATLELEKWKISRILTTSVSRIRNYAAVNYMHQANVKEFKILEVMDRITCAHCQNMNNRVFKVTVERAKIEKVIKQAPANIGKLAPFVTQTPVTELEKMDDSEVQAKGVMLPFHPHCRGVVRAITDI